MAFFNYQQHSRVLTSEVARAPQYWFERSLLIPHEVLRHALMDMEFALQPQHFPGNPEQDFKVRNFFKWYRDYFYWFTHHHHDTEEDLFIPWIKSRATLPAKVQDDHTTLLRQMKDILDMEVKFMNAMHAPNPMQERYMLADMLRHLVHDFSLRMRAHLAEEEEVVAPLLRDYFTYEEEQEMVEKIIERFPLSHRGEALAWVARIARIWMLPHEYEEFLLVLPGPVKFMLDKMWNKQHLEKNVGLLRSVTYDFEPPSRPNCECGCVIS